MVGSVRGLVWCTINGFVWRGWDKPHTHTNTHTHTKADNVRITNTKARSHNHCCRGKKIIIKYYVCVCIVTFLCRIMSSSVSCPALQYFSTLSDEWNNFRETVIEQKTCVLIFSANLPEIFLILRRIKRDVIISVCMSSCKVPLFFSDFNQTSIFSTDFRKIDQRCGLIVRVSDYWSWSPGFKSRLYHGDFFLKGKIPMVTMVWVV
jgi:hypothetical protein